MSQKDEEEALKSFGRATVPWLMAGFQGAVNIWNIKPEERERLFGIFVAGAHTDALAWQRGLMKSGCYDIVAKHAREEAAKMAKIKSIEPERMEPGWDNVGGG